jgi:hypothetical membrane protein
MMDLARTVSIVGFVCSFGLVAMLHILRTDLPPAAHRLSEYANGPHGWMMTASFVALGGGLLAMGVTLRTGRRTDKWALGVSALAFIAGAGTILSGIFPTGASDSEESIHSPASALAVVAVVALALAHSILSAHRRPWRTPDSTGTTLALIALALAALSPLLHNTRWTGLSQRVLWIVLLSWLLRANWPRPAGSTPSVLVSRDDVSDEIHSGNSRASGLPEGGG